MSKWNLAKGAYSWGKSKISPTITSLKGRYNIGSADKVKSKAAKSNLESASFHLGRTFSKTDKSLKNFLFSLNKTFKRKPKYIFKKAQGGLARILEV